MLKGDEMSPRDETTRAKHAEVLEKVRIASDYWELKAIKDKAAMERKALLSRADSSYAVAGGKTYVRRIFKNLKASLGGRLPHCCYALSAMVLPCLAVYSNPNPNNRRTGQVPSIL